MNKRLKELRKTLKLTQQEFANRIGIKRNNIACYETEKNTPSDAVISLICREFNVSENWFRNGEGEMFLQSDRKSEINKLTQQLLSEESDSFKNRFINMLANLSVDEWKLLEKVAKELLETPSVDEEPNGQLCFELDNFSQKQENTAPKTNNVIEEKVEAYRKELEAESKGVDESPVSQTGNDA